jgi:cytochrome c553
MGANDMTMRSLPLSIGAFCVCLALLALADPPAHADDIAAGRKKAAQCQACHGLDGLSKLPVAPNLAGQPEPYLIKALNDFRSGARQNEIMSIMIKSLSDTDVANLAAYYAAIEITAKPPQ